ncbi:MAG: cohesin domain-containing protein [Anaerolineaceae bacterium]
MKTYRKHLGSVFYWLVVVILTTTNLLVANVKNVHSQSLPLIQITPASATLDTCEELEISVRIENVTNLTGYHLEVSYDPGLVEIIEVKNGDFLVPGLFEPGNFTDPSSGLISFGMVQQNTPENPVEPKTGSGNLITIRLRALQAGATVHFTINPTSVLVNWPEATYIPFDSIGGEVTTREYTNVVQNWYLAEGYTGNNTSTFILVQNPTVSTAQICVTYMLQGGGVKMRKIEVAPQSRYTIAAQDSGQVGTGVAFSTKLASSQTIIVERSMYWPNGEGTQGGHATTGVTSPATEWYLAEGFTGANFMTYILIQNPNNEAANVEITYMPDVGSNIVKTIIVPGNSRFTVVVHDPDPAGPGIGIDKAFATRLVSTNRKPIIVERAMYFGNEGHEAMGVTGPNRTWYLAEGYTDLGFGTFILIQNPNEQEAVIAITYMLPGGSTVNKQITVAPYSRFTVVATEDSTYGVGAAKTFSTKLESTVPIIVERAMYWPNGTNTQAGHDSPGVTAAAKNWNLAEGFTGAGFDTRILIQNPNAEWADLKIIYMKQGGGVITKTVSIQPYARFTIIGSEGSLFGVGPDLAFATRIESNQPIIVERAMYFPGGGHGTTGVPE